MNRCFCNPKDFDLQIGLKFYLVSQVPNVKTHPVKPKTPHIDSHMARAAVARNTFGGVVYES
jgi:hypothetical protein